MKCEVREICGDWALDIDGFNGGKITIHFNSRQNALSVKRIIETDDSLSNAADDFDRQPTIDVIKGRHGHWIDKSTQSCLRTQSWCSACGKRSGIGGIESNRHKAYCPNCGARMDGVKI